MRAATRIRFGELFGRSGVTVVDVEASSLGVDSWPIETGIARVVRGEVRSEARLIKPEPDWDMAAWSAESAEVHGISLEQLHDEGRPAVEVAQWFEGETNGAGISDAPEFDGRWIEHLLSVIRLEPRVTLIDFDTLVAATVPDVDRLKQIYGHLDAHPAPHRADGDAARLAAAWLAGGGPDGLPPPPSSS